MTGGSASTRGGGPGGGAQGGGGWSVLGPRPAPALPTAEELSPLRHLQHADLFGGGAPAETPLLVPLTNGAATNLNFDESHGEAQEALIERYLGLMGFAPKTSSPTPNGGGGSVGGATAPLRAPSPNLDPALLDAAAADPPASFASEEDSRFQLQPPSRRPLRRDVDSSALYALGLDRPTLTRRAVPEALIGALHRGLAANAAAFFRTCLAEQRRLVLLTHGSGPSVPLADRLLAFITGVEDKLAAGSALPDMAELRQAKDTQAVLDSVHPPKEPPVGPFHHELMHLRNQAPSPPPEEPEPEGPDLEALMDLDKITALATAGNVPGLRALMRGLVDAIEYTRSNLRQRLAAEGERAQREWARATESRETVERLREQLAARNAIIGERGAEIEASSRRATAAEEALVTERAIVAGLRSQLRQLTADYEAQHRQLRTLLEAQATATSPSVAMPALKARSAPDPSSIAPEGTPDDPHAAVHKLGAELAATRSELALAELGMQQERAGARQLRVMLESVRATVDMHATRAAAAAAEVERLNRLVAASQDLANASTGGLAMLEQQLAQEKAAHRRTTDRLQAVGWKFEQARTAVVDIRARAAHHLRKLQTALGDTNLRAIKAERQLGDVTIELRRTKDKLESTTNSWEALKDRLERQDADMEATRREAIAARLDVKEVSDKLRETQVSLRTAEAKVEQMQEKVSNDAETVLAGRAATEKLETLEKHHQQLGVAHEELSRAHEVLSEAHSSLTEEMDAARVRLADLEVKAVQLEELTVKHDELTAAKSALDQQHADLVKAHAEMAAELAGMKRHADVLAEQVQEYRRLAERSQIDLETEKELHRHTQDQLAITAAKRDEFEVRCIEMTGKLEAMAERMKGVDDEVERCRRTAELAGYQRAEAFAMRDGMNRARMMLAGDMKEYLKLVEGHVQQLDACVTDLRVGLAGLQSRVLDVRPETVAGTMAELPAVSFDELQRTCDAMFKVLTHGSQLLETQSDVRRLLIDRIEMLEEGAKERLGTASEFWRQVLALSRAQPRSMVQIVERMTGQTCRDLELDPVNPLARMVPLGVLEETGQQVNLQFERAGELRSDLETSRAQSDTATRLLEHERGVTAARTLEFQSLIDALSREVHRLKAKAGALEANNVMQQRATAEMQRLLTDAEWKVAKAQEREALYGIKNMVPHGRETKAVQTVFSDLYMMSGGTAPGLAAAGQRSQFLHQRSTITEAAAADAGWDWPAGFGGGEGGGEGGWRVVDDPGPDGGAAVSAAVAALQGYEPPASPASLPPLSAIASPAQSWTAGVARGGTPVGYGSGLRSAGSVGTGGLQSSGGAGGGGGSAGGGAAGPARPASHLSRSSSAISPGLAALAGALRSASPPDVTAMGTSDAAGSRPSSQPQALSPTRPPPRRRHPDEVSRRGSALSPVPSSNGAFSSASGGAAAGAADGAPSWAAAAAAAGSNEGYGSDGQQAAAMGPGDQEAEYSEEAEEEDSSFPPSPSASPRMPLRTPSTAATAAAAAVFAANAGGGGGGSGGGPPGSGPPHRAATAAGVASSAVAGIAASSLPSRPATAGSALIAMHPHPHSAHGHQPPPNHHIPRLSGSFLPSSRPSSPSFASPPTPSGIPHGWQYSAWDWLPDAAPLTRGSHPYSRQALLELIADIHYTKGLHDQVAAAAAFPATSMQQYIGAYFEARHGPRGSSPPSTELALAQLLVSLEAHSALYDVMLFARAAGLQAWSGKGLHRNGSHHSSRPATANVPATQPPAVSGGGFARPRTSRAALNTMSPYAAASAGGGGGPAGGLRQSAAAAAAAAARGRNVSGRATSAGSPSGPLMLGLVPSSARVPSTAAEAYDASGSPPPSAPGGETMLRLRTGLSPAVASTSATAAGQNLNQAQSINQRHQSGRAFSRRVTTGSTSAAFGSLAGPPPAPKLQLRVRPEVLLSEPLSGLLGRLGEVLGMEALAQFISSGRMLGRLRAADLGQPLRDDQHPELHFLVHRVCGVLGLQDPPELMVRESLPFGWDTMLLQLPNVGTSALGVLAASDVDRQPAPSAGSAPSTAAGGWRRRAVLLLSAELVEAAAAAAVATPEDPTQGDPTLMDGEELQALLGLALAPIAMPGGYGWRLDVQGAAASAPRPASAAPVLATAPGSAAQPGPAPTLLSAAEVVTIVNLAALKPRALVSTLPSQLQFQWDKLLSHLRTVAAATTVSADRGALLASQAVAPSVRAVYRAAAGLSVYDTNMAGNLVGRGEELVLQAQTMPITNEEMMAIASIPMHEVAAVDPDVRQRYALARVALLARWAESPDYRQTLRAAVL